MSTVLCIILFVAFVVAQVLFIKMTTHKVIKYLPMSVSAIVCVFAIVLHIYTMISYYRGIFSESVLAENQYFATFILIPAGISLVGSVIGFLVGKKQK